AGPPLLGFRVLELAERVAGPSAASYLADLGADVMKVECRGGDPGRARADFGAWNRSKRAVIADPADLRKGTRLAKLLAEVDIAIVDEVWQRRLHDHGVDLDDVTNGHAVVCRLEALSPPGGGRMVTDEDAIAAATGLMACQPGHHEGPSRYMFPVLGVFSGMLGALGATAGLLSDARGHGTRHPVVSLVGVAAFLQGIVGATQQRPTEAGSAVRVPTPLGLNQAYRCYRASDGWLCVTCTNPDFYARFCLSLGLEHLVVDERFRYAPWGVAIHHQPVQEAAITPRIASRTVAEWMAVFEEFDVPAQPVQSLGEFLESDIVSRNELLIPAADVRLPRFPATIDGWRQSEIEPTPAPHPHFELTDLEWDPPPSEVVGGQKAARRRAGTQGPLEGMVVVDFGSYLAGPLCSTLLADLGADVIKIEPPEGEGLRSSGLSCISINRGKRGLAVDLQHPDGRAVVDTLLEGADVVVTAFRPGVAERLGLDYERLVGLNPGVVTVNIEGYGDVPRLAGRPSFDPLIQALSGQMQLQGALADKPVCFTVSLNDFGAGFVGALSAVTLLLRRQLTGNGGRASVIQAGVALHLLAGHVAADGEGKELSLDPFRSDPLHGIYPTEGGHTVVVAENRKEILDWLGLDGAATDDVVEAAMAQRLVPLSCEPTHPSSLQLVPVAPPFMRGFDRSLFAEAGIAWGFEHPYFGEVRSAGRPLRFEGEAPLEVGPYIGEHTREILTELGYEPATINDLLESKIVASPVPDWVTSAETTSNEEGEDQPV
ncbi:MAG: CoA transferase, partial [Actinomycetia bacterium]|nr:CoA transferase [Actinomycetes bacterium]